jgi:hypothetical protein
VDQLCLGIPGILADPGSLGILVDPEDQLCLGNPEGPGIHEGLGNPEILVSLGNHEGKLYTSLDKFVEVYIRCC